MKPYSLKDARRVYSYCGKSPNMCRIANHLTFFCSENFLRKKAVDRLNLKAGDRVLELACGIGNNFGYLMEKVGSKGEITGVDYVDEMLNAAKKESIKKAYKNIVLIRKDAAKISFPRNYFDGVISTIGLSAIPDHEGALKRAVYSLKNGKRIVILDGKMFEGFYKILNPLMGWIRWSESWDSSKDIINDAKALLRDVEIEKFFGGSFYILTGIKRQ